VRELIVAVDDDRRHRLAYAVVGDECRSRIITHRSNLRGRSEASQSGSFGLRMRSRTGEQQRSAYGSSGGAEVMKETLEAKRSGLPSEQNIVTGSRRQASRCS